ncbi:SusC/RagA family TonB-linked outer membrane protein [Agriterribacter sp.]|uniref:SusC/RagA family TonB-linked outer membrane protein n=1 Tax=Agriterribacter sp. TaxID=2821509 RepID=UPI002D1CB843|nr:SusC/RagA family TonB-linked outer membrane protein [Agriterribacter sp.]HRP56759.1 SusC/RagA family TonB-linked outer membrane protein [Agriterribacter sp.]
MAPKRLLQCIALSIFLLFFSFSTALAQNKTITGKVTDSKDGSPIVGVSVQVKGSRSGTTTNISGDFSITVPASAKILAVSAVGYEDQEVPIDSDNLNILLVASTSNLEEVVVVGYGTARKKDLTGAVASVQEKDFNRGVITAPDQLIQGKAAGVLVINNTGQPGGSTTIRVRGSSSIRSGNQPLFVIDGVPLSGGSSRPGTSGGGSYGSDGGNPLNFINPNDIASMEILKDASATAIYGSRGANGVILITTKRGKSGAPQLDANASVGVSNVLKKLEVLNADEYRNVLQDYNIASGDYGGNEDPWDAITRTAITQNYNTAISGGTENGRYRISAGYLDQQGVIETSKLKKITANLTSSFKFLESKKLGLDVNVLVTQTNENIAPVSAFVGFEGNIISQALQWNPTLKVRQSADSITTLQGTTINPLASLAYYKDRAVINTIVASIAPSYKITDDLEYKFLYSVNRQTGVRKGMVDRRLNLDQVHDHGNAFIGNGEQTNQQVTNTLSYNKEVTSGFNVNAVVGHEWLIFDNRGGWMSGKDFQNIGLDYYNYIQQGITSNREIGSYASPTTELQSYFARAILNFQDKYLVTGTFRADGSTRFGENKKYGYFPSIGAAWNISNESFMAGNNIFNNLKLRFGWGKTGNQEFASGASLARFSIGANNGGYSQTNFANPDLRWETSATTNAGIDFEVLDGRIYGSVDYFYKKTTDVLFERTLAQPAPSGKIWVNLDGYVLNKGWEISLTGALMRNDRINWNITGNASFLQNTVKGLSGFYQTGELRGQGFTDVDGQRVVSDHPLNVWYLGIFEGIDKATGQSIYKDGDPSAFKYYVGSPNPKMLLGLSTDFSYRKFTATINMNGTFGHYLFNNTAATVLGIGNLGGGRNVAKSIFNTDAKEATSNAAAPSTRYLEKGNYMKMANATLSYRIGDIGNAFRNVNISLTGQNLFVITKYSGFDPEVSTDGSVDGIPSLGIDYIPYPSARTVILGVNFSL